MGNIVKTVFGGSKSKSKNKAFPIISPQLTPNIGAGNQAMSLLGSLIGVNGPDEMQRTTDNYLASPGFKSMLDQGSRAITTNAASKGLLNSGSVLKGQMRFGQDLAGQQLDKLYDRLTSIGAYGLNSAQAITGAGQKSTTNDFGQGIFNSLFPKGLKG